MSCGKYSPTVSCAYQQDQEWFKKYKTTDQAEFDPEGFDSYGYDFEGEDRAGYTEIDYMRDDLECTGFFTLWDKVAEKYSFNGVKPVRK